MGIELDYHFAGDFIKIFGSYSYSTVCGGRVMIYYYDYIKYIISKFVYKDELIDALSPIGIIKDIAIIIGEYIDALES